MNEALSSPSPHQEQLQLLFMQYEQAGILERLGFDPAKYSITPQEDNLGYPLGDSRPRGLDITNNETGNRIYITGYSDPKLETELQEAFDVHNNQENTEHRRNFYPYFVFQRVERIDPNRKLQAYYLPKGIMTFYNAANSSLISDEEGLWLKTMQYRSFKASYMTGSHIRHPADVTPSDLAVLLGAASADPMHPKRGIYPIPKSEIDLSQI